MAVIPTRINSSGIFSVNSDFDEVTYNSDTPVIKNLLVHSNSFSTSPWTKGLSTTLTPAASTAPDGTITAWRLQTPATSGTWLDQPFSAVAGVTYIFSIYAKYVAPTNNQFSIFVWTSAAAGGPTSGSGTTNVVTTDNWTRYSVQFTATTTGTFSAAIDNTGNTLSPNVFIWGAQLEVGTIPTIYQGIAAAGTLVTPTFVNKTTTGTYYVTGNFDEVTYNSTTPVIKNLISYSQDFTQWSKNTAPNDYTVVSDSELAPDVTQTADLIIKSTGVGSSSIVYKLFSGIPNTEYCGSIYVKAGGYSKVSVRFGNTAFANQNIGGNFDLVTGTVNSILNGSTVTINSAENGWWRISITATSDNDGGNYVFAWVPLDDAYNANFTGNGTSGVYAWGAQVEIGSTATIYQPISASDTLISTSMRQRIDRLGNQYVTGSVDEVTGMIATDSLAGYWDAGKLESYVPGNTKLTDISGGTKNGTPSGPVTYSSSNGGYLSFSGTAFYDCPLGFVYNTTPVVDRTIAAWYRCTSSSAQFQGIIVIFDGGSNTQFEINLNPAGTSISVSNNQSSGTAGVAVSLNTWYYVVGTESHSGGIRTLNLYLNGAQVATQTASLPAYSFTADRVRLGCQKSGFPRTLLGDISNAQFYTKALSAAEVTNNFEALRDRFGI